jgi:hypothetical protein
MADWDVVGTAPAQIQNPWAVKSVAPAPAEAVTSSASAERPGSDTDTQHPLHDAVKFFAESLKHAPASLLSMISQAGDMVTDPYGTMAHTVLQAAKTAHRALANPEATISSVGSALENATPEQAGETVGAPMVAGLGVGGVGKGISAAVGASAEAAAEAASPAGRIGLRSNAGRPVASLAAGSSTGQTLDVANNKVALDALGREAGVNTDVHPVNHATLASAADPAGRVLDQAMQALPAAPLSPAAQAAIRAARPNTGLIKPTPDVESYVNQTERNLLGDPNDPTTQNQPVTGEDLRATRGELVSSANANAASDDAALRQRAKYQRDVIKALDQHIADTMPANSAISPEMIARARETLGKNYELRGLIGKGGDVDLQGLAADYRENPNKYTGAFQTVADFAHRHPEVTGTISDATRLSPPSFAHDVASINPIKPVGSLFQAAAGWAGRNRLLAGRGNPSSVPVAGLGGEFDHAPMTSLAPDPGASVGEPPPRQIPAPLEPPTTSAPGSRPNMPSLQPPLGTAFEPHQGELGLDPTLSEGHVPPRTYNGPPTPLANNASGQTPVSLEAAARVREHLKQKVQPISFGADDVEHIMSPHDIKRADLNPAPDSIFINKRDGSVINSGNMAPAQVRGLLARWKALHGPLENP